MFKLIGMIVFGFINILLLVTLGPLYFIFLIAIWFIKKLFGM